MGCSIQKQSKEIVKQEQQDSEIYEFKLLFSNIKIKNLPFKNSIVTLSINKQQIFQTQPINNNSNPHWKQVFQMTLRVNRYELKSSFFKISIKQADNLKHFTSVSQNMWEVAVGPIHYDLFLDSIQSKSRITFDLRMVQKITLKITSKQIHCELKTQLMEQAYNFQLKVRSHSVDYSSDVSPNYLNHHFYRQQQNTNKNFGFIDSKEKLRSESDEFQLVNNSHLESSMDENVKVDVNSFQLKKQITMQPPKLIKKSNSNSQLITTIPLKKASTSIVKKPKTTMELILKRDINWELRMQDNPPEIQFEIYVDEFASSSFEFILWSHNLVKNDKIVEFQLVGNSVISMNKFCSQNVSVLAELEILSVQEVKFKDKLWNHGQSVGKTKGDFIITNGPYFRQMLGGFRTEEGIQRSSLLYIKKNKYSSVENNQIKQIIQINMQLDELVGKLNQKNLPHRDKVKINIDISSIISKLMVLVSNQDLYRNQDEMIRSQLVLIDLAKNLLESADSVDEELREPYYDVLITLLNRDEFYISYIGFDQELFETYTNRKDQEYIKSNKKEIKSLEYKIRIALHYQNFLHKTLCKVTEKISQRVQNKKEQSFVYSFFVLAFFRIPEFQNVILNILRSDDRKLNEYFENDLINQDKVESAFSAEWGKNFYDYIKEEPRYQEHMSELKQILGSVDWESLVLKSGIFLKWLHLMLNHFKKAKLPYEMSVTWTGFPGYLMLVRHLLLEIKFTENYPYSDTIKEASNSLLENENIFNYMVIVLFHKTKLYDGIAVFHALDMISMWFDVLKKANKKVPTDFNYQFFMKGLFLIFDGQHASSISKALQLINGIFVQLPIEIQKEICDHLLDNCFFKFFMFWSKTVRWVFHHFLIYRIQHRLKGKGNVLDFEKEVEKIKIQEGVHILDEKTKSLNKLIYIKYHQMIEIVVKMKRIIASHSQQYDSVLQMQLEAKSIKLKLMKKKRQYIMNQNQRHRKQSDDGKSNPQNLGSIDFSFEAFIRSNKSLTFSQLDPIVSSEIRQSEMEDQIEEMPQNNQYIENDDFAVNDNNVSSLINLDEILQEIELEQKQKQQKKQRIINRKNSFEVNSQHSNDKQKNTNKKKFKIYHRFTSTQKSPNLQISKDQLQYLILAMQEWQEQQANYKRWLINTQNGMKKNRIPNDLQDSYVMDAEPPDIVLYVPMDEAENEQVNY